MTLNQVTAPGRGLFAIRLAVMNDLTLELSRAGSEGELRRLAREIALERLGFDRLELRLFDKGVTGHRRCPLRFYHDIECLDGEGRSLGRADRASALLWDGERDLGEIVADNLPSGREIDGGSLELLVLYARTVGHFVSRIRDEEELRLQASTDALTGVMNRRVCLMFLEKQLSLASRGGSPLSVAYLDLDGLKRVNDSFGHAEGDAYISAISELLTAAVRNSDVVGRLGGDEFLVVFPDCQAKPASAVMSRVAESAVERCRAEGKPYPYSLSWGVASLSELAPSKELPAATALLELADRRMYEDKVARKAARS
jgi:diguanylate cyclase (GGDEF)-like protein